MHLLVHIINNKILSIYSSRFPPLLPVHMGTFFQKSRAKHKSSCPRDITLNSALQRHAVFVFQEVVHLSITVQTKDPIN